MDVFTPFPVHGMEKALGLEESRLHYAGFVYGAIGTLTAFLGMTWIMTSDWPIILVENHTGLFLLSFLSYLS